MNKKISILISFLGFALLTYILSNKNLTIAEAAWFFWSASFLYLPVWGLLALSEYFFFYGSKDKDRSKSMQSAKSFVGSPVRFVLMTIVAVIIPGLFHVFVGLFLSITLPIEPLELFSVNGFSKNFDITFILYPLKKFAFLIPTFVLLKSSLLFVEPGLRLRGHSNIRDGLLPLIAGFFTSFVFRNELSQAAVPVFAACLFLPWSLVMGKDRYDKASTREPEFSIPIELPIEHVYRPNVSPFWGILFFLFGGLILSLALFMSSKTLKAEPGAILATAFAVFIGIAVASAFTFAAMNMLFAYRKVFLSSNHIEVIEKGYLVVIPKVKSWVCSLSDYSKVVASQRVFPASSDTNAYYFVVTLIHKSNSKQNIELYRAYHSDDYQQVAEKWKKVLNLEVS